MFAGLFIASNKHFYYKQVRILRNAAHSLMLSLKYAAKDKKNSRGVLGFCAGLVQGCQVVFHRYQVLPVRVKPV
jgi:hypothetical protein